MKENWRFGKILHVRMTEKGCELIVGVELSYPKIGDIVTLNVKDGKKKCEFKIAKIDFYRKGREYMIEGSKITPVDNLNVCTLHEVIPHGSDVYYNKDDEFDLDEIYYNSTIRI